MLAFRTFVGSAFVFLLGQSAAAREIDDLQLFVAAELNQVTDELHQIASFGAPCVLDITQQASDATVGLIVQHQTMVSFAELSLDHSERLLDPEKIGTLYSFAKNEGAVADPSHWVRQIALFDSALSTPNDEGWVVGTCSREQCTHSEPDLDVRVVVSASSYLSVAHAVDRLRQLCGN